MPWLDASSLKRAKRPRLKKRAWWVGLLLVGCVAGLAAWRARAVHRVSETSALASSVSWNRQEAAGYLDEREVWWQEWPQAQMDHGTICVSCHTAVPYALARPTLGRDLHETGMAAPERFLLDSVEKRVGNWSKTDPYYTDA